MRDFIYYVGLLVASRLASCQDNPSPASFLRRSSASAVVLGDYVFIDGGEVSQTINGTEPSHQRPSYPANSTLSISLKDSWTNTSVVLASINKTAPLLNGQAVWASPSSTAFYSWAGSSAYSSQPPDRQIWRFDTDGSGGGSWVQITPSNAPFFKQLVRPQGCAFATVKNSAYCLGGLVTSLSDAAVTSSTELPVPGMVSVDLTSGTWANTSTANTFNPSGTLINARAEPVPFGTGGAILFLGGSQAAATTPGSYPASAREVDFTNITIFDVASGKWHSQPTTGTRPSARERFCTVGAAGQNGTYEIFMYGGLSSASNATGSSLPSSSDDVYVLSLPGFVFFKAPASTGTPRSDHACVVVGKGGRQMLSVGGIDASQGFPGAFLEADPWRRGLGVFDMVSLAWTAGYDASAAPYSSPQVVRSWYAKDGMASVSWASDAVKAMFTTVSQESSQPASSSSSSSLELALPLGAVIGIAIAGLIIVGLILGVTISCLRRRRAITSRRHTFFTEGPGEWRGDSKANRSTGYAVRIRGNATPIPMTPTTDNGRFGSWDDARTADAEEKKMAKEAKTKRGRPKPSK